MRLDDKRFWLLSAIALLLVAGFTSERLQAQLLYGSIVGSVTDPSGSIVPGATVTITNRGTGLTRETTADGQGNYVFNNVLPGSYNIRFSSEGFRTLTREAVEVGTGMVVRSDASMEVGAIAEQITVSASSVQLQTDRADTQTSITTKPIQALPLNLYRNYQALINLVPGSSPAAFQNSATDTPAASLSTNVNGTPRNMNVTRLDGAVNMNIWLPHHNMYVAPSEAVAEVNVSTTAMEADQGIAGGASITVVTKSGTNEFHGSAWEYHNNQRMRSRNFFMGPDQEKPRDTLNIFGGTLGGPIVRNRLFFFGHYEATRQRTGGFGIFDVPDQQVRTGNFSQAVVPGANIVTPIYDPLTGDSQGRGRQQFPGNIIPADRISPIAQRVLQGVPNPNVSAPVQNFQMGATGIFDRNNYDYKINWNRSDRHQIWGKSSFLQADVTGVAAFGEFVGPAVVQDPGTGDTFVQVHTVGHTYTVRPTLLIDQNFGLTRMNQDVIGNDFGTNWGSDVFGIPGTNGPDPRQSGMPNFAFGYSNVGLSATWMPMFRTDQSFTHDTNVSWVRGSHNVRFGFNLVHHQLNHWQPEIANPRGNFDFNGNVTALNGGVAPNFYNQFAAFLLGMPRSISKSLQWEEMTGREWQTGFYITDRWQLAPRLTMSLGMRLDYFPLMTRKDTGLELYDPATNMVSMTGRGPIPVNQGLSINNPLFAPRIGIAYRATEKTVIRTGYGLTWDPLPFSRPLRGFYPLTVSGDFLSENEFTPVGTLAQGIPAFSGPDLSLGTAELPTTAQMRSPWGEINRGYIQSWNFTVERELPGNLVTSVAYVGTQVTNQLADRNINTAGPGTPTDQLPLAQLHGRRITTNMWDGWLSSNYHSLQTSVNRQFANGLMLKGAYTWAKAINMTDDNGWTSVNFNWEPVIHRNRARAGYDRRHVFQLAYVYEMPFGRQQRFLNSGPLSWILGNWSVNGMFYSFTGTPMTFTSNAALNAPGNLQTANQLKEDVEIYGNVGPGQKWFDTTAFGAPAVNTFGSAGRNTISGPGRIGTDMRLSRIFPVGETFRLEVMGEAFNLTNTPWFSNPSTNVDAGTYGEIRSTVTQSGRGVSDRQFRVGAILRF